MSNWRRLLRQHERMHAIVEEVATEARVTPEDIYGDSRRADIVLARQIAQWRVSEELGYSTSVVGRHFNRDHASIIHSLKKIDAMMKALEDEA